MTRLLLRLRRVRAVTCVCWDGKPSRRSCPSHGHLAAMRDGVPAETVPS